jgi:two-component system sensor histidine kinase TctE
VDLVAVAKEVTSEMVPAALARDIDLGLEGTDDAVVNADPILMAELLRNLVSNAITYAGQGAVVTVRVRAPATGPVLEVEDNGPGLSPAQMAVAVRAGRGSSRPLPQLAKGQPNGMGLGLAVAAEIAALFKADFRLEKARSDSGLLAAIAFGQTAD